MPSRDDFLAGLIAPTNKADDECSICYFPLKDPVSLPCAHVYDRECIQIWLAGSNTCPTCRAVFFDLPRQQPPANLPTTGPGSQAYGAMLRRALRLSGLQEDRSNRRTALRTFTYGSFTESEMFDASVAAAHFLKRDAGQTDQGEFFLNTPEGGREIVRGMAVLDATDDDLLARIVAFIHLVPAMRASIGTPYDERKLRDWHVLMTLLKDEWEVRHGQLCDVNLLAEQFRASITQRLAGLRVEVPTPFLGGHEQMDGLNLDKLDFDLVLDYVCYFCWKKQQDQQ